MAATRLITLHARKGKGTASSLRERLDYAQNPDKTEQGKLITSYECNEKTAWLEFSLSHQELCKRRRYSTDQDVIAYQIRQSFSPGEITAEEANRIGYETAMRFTKGKHAFTVSTHTDRAHIHNHIIFNSANLDASGKWQNYFYSGIVLQRLSDLICIEHGVSVIRRYDARTHKKITWPVRRTLRDSIRDDILKCMEAKPRSLQEVLKKLEQSGYEIKRGKDISLRRQGSKNYIRMQSLGSGFREEDIGMLTAEDIGNRAGKDSQQLSLMIDIEKKIREGKGSGYEHWAKSFNLKQMAESLLFLQEHEVDSLEKLDEKTEAAVKKFHDLADQIKVRESRLHEIAELKTHIINYVKTREVYKEYRKAGYSKRFLEEHRAEIEIHKAAKTAFDKAGVKKLPKVKELSAEYSQVLEEKKKCYTAYREAKKEMQHWTVAQKNVSMILGTEKKNPERQKETRSR